MPILDVEVVLRPGEPLPPRLASEIAARAGEVFGAEPGTTWVKVRELAAESYAESGGGPPEGFAPVFVSVLKARLPEPQELAAEVAAVVQAVAGACGRLAENVHVVYEPAAAGRIAFGGRLVVG